LLLLQVIGRWDVRCVNIKSKDWKYAR